jgi:hypothetical protein
VYGVVDRVFVVGNEQPEDVEVILLVRGERRAVEEAVNDVDGSPVLVVAADGARGKRPDQREVVWGTAERLGLGLDVHGVHLITRGHGVVPEGLLMITTTSP